MKKALLLLASAALLFAGCAKERIASGEADGDQVTVTFSAGLTTEGTKAVADGDGNGAKVNHWVLQVRDADNALFYKEERTVTAGTPEALVQTYELKLFKNQSYTLQFWADTKGAYNTGDLTAISKSALTANADSLDAFSANVNYTSLVSESKNVTLKRPFAQLNIITCDLADLKSKVVSETYAKYAPTSLQVKASVPTTFNVQTQTAGTAAEQTLTATASYADFLAGAAETTLFMDYIFASASEADVVAVDFSSQSEKNSISYNFTNIPLRRNYRTNIKGNLMSNDSEWKVVIDPEWNTPEYVEERWAAGMVTPVTPDEEGVYNISLPSELAWIAQQVNAGNTFAGKTVKLAKDIDLNNGEWTPIGNVPSYPSKTFAGTFDGNGKTISNLNVSDFTVEYASAGLFGSITGTVKNVTVENAVVRSSHYAGAICGYSSAQACVIENCHVKKSSVTSVPEWMGDEYNNGDKAGGIIGYIATGDKVNNCSVENVTVTAHRDLGAVVGCAINGAAAGVTSNTAKNCTVHQSNENAYKTGVTTFGKIIGRHNNDVPTNNVATNVELVSYDLEIYTVADLFGFAEKVNAGTFSGKKAILMNDINLNNAAWAPVGTTSSKFDGTFEGNGKSISNFKVTSSSNYAGLFGAVFGCSISNLTVANATVSNTGENYSGVLVGSGYAHISNCTVKNSSVTGVDQVGAVIGYLSCGYVKNSVVENVNVTANGDRAGGITGKANVDSQYEISGNTVRNSTIVATNKIDNFRSAAALVGQIMASATNSWKIIDNTIINVSTKTGDDVLFVPVGEFRNGSFQTDAVIAGHIAGIKWQVEGADDTYILFNPANTEQYVVINNAESDN